MSKEGQKVYNGIVLLMGYLQRLYVFENIHHQLHVDYDSNQMNRVKELVDDTLAMIPIVEQTKELAPSQLNKLEKITAKVKELMSHYFKEGPLTFQEKLAYVGSSLYAEAYVNAGIIRLGEIFKVEVNKDFMKRTKFYEERTKFIDIMTQKLKNQEQIEDLAIALIEQWFLNVWKMKTYTISDLEKIGILIGFSNQKN